MELGARIRPLPNEELIQIKRTTPTALDVKLEICAELIKGKLLSIPNRAELLVFNAPTKMPVSIIKERTIEYAVGNMIKTLVDHLEQVVNAGGKKLRPGVANKFAKLLKDELVKKFDVPPYFKGSGFSEQDKEKLKSDVRKIILDSIIQ